MIITNRFNKTFGPVASFSGIVILCAGLFLVITNIEAIVLVVVGAFIAFTRSYTSIDTGTKQVKTGDLLFGLVKRGEWIAVTPQMQIGPYKSNKVYRTYSRSNRVLDIKDKRQLIGLFDKNGNKIAVLKQLKESEDIDLELKKLINTLGLERME